MHGDQTGRDGGTKTVKEENETLDDLEHNEDGRGCCLLSAAFKDESRSSRPKPIKKRRCATRLDEKRADASGVENRSCEPPDPGLAALPSFLNHLGDFFPVKSRS